MGEKDVTPIRQVFLGLSLLLNLGIAEKLKSANDFATGGIDTDRKEGRSLDILCNGLINGSPQ